MIQISTTASNRIRIHTTAPNGQTLSDVEITVENADKMIYILTSCCKKICPICQNRAQYQFPGAPYFPSDLANHREAGPAHPGPQAGSYSDGSPSGGGHGPV
jgi:hypothetical protein